MEQVKAIKIFHLLLTVFTVNIQNTWAFPTTSPYHPVTSCCKLIPSFGASGPVLKVENQNEDGRTSLDIRLEAYEKTSTVPGEFLESFAVNWKHKLEDNWHEGRLLPQEDLVNGWELQQISASLTHWEHKAAFQLDDGECLLQMALTNDDLSLTQDPYPYPHGSRNRNLFKGVANKAAPFWPNQLRHNLSKTCLHGCGTIVFDADRFLDIVSLSAAPGPILFPHGSFKLDLKLSQCMDSIQDCLSSPGCVQDFLNFVGPKKLANLSGGRLVGELPTGELVQVGDDLQEGQEATLSRIKIVEFQEGSLGLLFCPITSDDRGAEVMEVEEGGQAFKHGVKEGWVFKSINGVDVRSMPFSDIDSLFDLASPWKVEFDTACTAERLYAVEIPAEEGLKAIGLEVTDRCNIGSELQTKLKEVPVLWRESFARLFVGDPGSTTCLHVDLVPQLEFCHVLQGTKLLGVASRDSTPDLLRSHIETAEDMCETKIPVHRPLEAKELELLEHPEVSVVMGLPGDIVTFASGAAHFATNGAEGLSAALFHGMVTPATVPHMCETLDPFTAEERAGRFGNHLSGMDLLNDGLPSNKDLWAKLNELTEKKWIVPKCKQGILIARRSFLDCLNDMEEAVLVKTVAHKL